MARKMTSDLKLSAGILNVIQKDAPEFMNDFLTPFLETMLQSEELILTVETSSVEKNSSKIKDVLQKWITVTKLDFIITIGYWSSEQSEDEIEIYESGSSEYTLNTFILLQILDDHMLPRQCYSVEQGTVIIKLPFDFYNKPLKKWQMELSKILSIIHDFKTCDGFHLDPDFSLKGAHSENHLYKSNVRPIKVAERPRNSIYPMISVKEALECIIKESNCLNTEEKSFHDCFSYVLSEDIIASEPYPPFPASIKDGYAVLARDFSQIRQVIGSVTPGCKLDFNLIPGTCVRVSTGSVIPYGADAVIQVEDTAIIEKDYEGNERKIKILKPVKIHQDIRPIGSDIAIGQILVPKNSKISSAEMGVMATCGIQRVLVFQKPWVALLSTGDEIVEPDAPLFPGCIRDSNKSSLIYMLKENRIPVINVGIARDLVDDVKGRLISAFQLADIIITTGGVSMGEKDILKQVLEVDFNATIHFGRVFMKPGKPTTFSTVWYNGKKKMVFSLPGNPVSAYVCFYLFVIPCIKVLMGYKESCHNLITVELSEDIHLDERPEFRRVFLKCNDNGVFVAHSTGPQQSSRLLSMQNADALLLLPPRTTSQTVIKANSKVDAITLKTI